MKDRPVLLQAMPNGEIVADENFLMLARHGEEWVLPRPEDLMPLPPESEIFLLPSRHAVGMDKDSGELVQFEELAVAAFVAPAHTLTGHPVYVTAENAPILPLFAYAAVGMIGDKFYVCAKKVDEDVRQVFTNISQHKIDKAAKKLIQKFPKNRLMQHLMHNCVLRYSCPAAKNLALGRYEAPLPTSNTCNARCIGCISHQDKNSGICQAPQDRMNFTPTASEIVEVMLYHAEQEPEPIFSFGQGCEGEPLTQGDLLIESIKLFRQKGGKGTVNLNSNASLPNVIAKLADAGLNSLRISLNSARAEVYQPYYRPVNYTFADVCKSMEEARARGLFISLNLLYFPGISDCEEELSALIKLVNSYHINFIQLRNLNIDPEMYLDLLKGLDFGPCVGLQNFKKRLKKSCPHLEFGYFNPGICSDLE